MINSNFRKAPNFSIKYGYSINTSNLGDTANKTYTNAPTIDFDAYIWEKITFKTDYSYTFITNGSETLNEFDLWNASFLYRNKDDSKFEYEVKIANILDAKSRNQVSNSEVAFTLNQTFIQPRFVSFRVVYNL